jgi:hypothetical protein
MVKMKYEIVSMSEIEACSTGHWHSKGAKRFFKSRLPLTGFKTEQGTYYFVSSEQQGGSPRRYTIRKMEQGRTSTVGEFQGYADMATAKAILLNMLNKGELT